MAKILLVEDDIDLCGRMDTWLNFENHSVECVHDGIEASERLKFYTYELIILDWDLPKKNGLDVCKDFRSFGGTTPIIMLTGKDAVTEKETGLDAGSDDYLTKPFHLKELSARIRAVMRRPTAFAGTVMEIAGVKLNPATHQVTVNGKEIILVPKEYALLEFFMRHPEQVFSPETLLNRIWNSENDASVDTIYTHMKTLRKKISPKSPTSFIKTIHGIGYKLEHDGEPVF